MMGRALIPGAMRAVIVIRCLMGSVVGADTAPYFPPRAFVEEDLPGERNDIGDLLAGDFSRHLRAMNEPSLWGASQRDKRVNVYRFLWLPTWERPVAVRVERVGDGATVSLVQLDGAGGYDPGKIAINRRVTVGQKEWHRLTTLVGRAGLWDMPTRITDLGHDGENFLVEGVADGKYHVVYRWTPAPGAYRELCRCMLDLTGLDLGQASWPAPSPNRSATRAIVFLSGLSLTAIVVAVVLRWAAHRRKPRPSTALEERP